MNNRSIKKNQNFYKWERGGTQGMLISFKVKNYACFSEETEISFRESSELKNRTWDNEREKNAFEAEKDILIKLNDDVRVVPRLALLGANASGKSFALKALNTLIELVKLRAGFFDYLVEKGFPPCLPFKFCEKNLQQPTYYETIFFIKDKFYKYILLVNKNEVKEERLCEVDGSEDHKEIEEILSRKDNRITMSEPAHKSIADTADLTILQKTFWSQTLFLSLMESLGVQSAAEIVKWFKNSSYMNEEELIFKEELDVFDRFEWFKELIENVEYRVDFKEHINKLDELIKDIEFEYVKNKREEIVDCEIRTAHVYSNLNGEKEEKTYPIDIESDGTKKLMYFLPRILPILKNGGMLIVDELDAKFHPLLIKYILLLFSNKEINSGKAQIVFSIHNGVILTFMRYDEIYLVEKDEKGKSEVCSLVDYYKNDERLHNKNLKFNSNYNWYIDYLQGRYNAVPNL